jgi:hypothetical protein
MGGSLTGPNKIKDVYKKIVFYDDNKFKVDNGSSDVVITSADNFSGDTEQTLINKTIDADNNTISNLEVDNLKSGVLDTDLSSVAITDTTIASAKAIKTYIDTQDSVKANTTYVDSQDATKLTKSDNLSDLTSASTARTNLGVDVAGTDNSTDVTLAGKDYITASGTNNQTLTLGTIDISDDTNLTASTGITLTDDTLTTNDSEIDHDNLNNYDGDEHVGHSFVTLTAGYGLTGGGDITTSRSFAVDTSVIATKTYVDSQVSTVNSLGEMTDVSLTSLTNGDLLQYNSSSSEWNNTNEIDGGPFTGS